MADKTDEDNGDGPVAKVGLAVAVCGAAATIGFAILNEWRARKAEKRAVAAENRAEKAALLAEEQDTANKLEMLRAENNSLCNAMKEAETWVEVGKVFYQWCAAPGGARWITHMQEGGAPPSPEVVESMLLFWRLLVEKIMYNLNDLPQRITQEDTSTDDYVQMFAKWYVAVGYALDTKERAGGTTAPATGAARRLTLARHLSDQGDDTLWEEAKVKLRLVDIESGTANPAAQTKRAAGWLQRLGL
jgi:hypothetical protein